MQSLLAKFHPKIEEIKVISVILKIHFNYINYKNKPNKFIVCNKSNLFRRYKDVSSINVLHICWTLFFKKNYFAAGLIPEQIWRLVNHISGIRQRFNCNTSFLFLYHKIYLVYMVSSY